MDRVTAIVVKLDNGKYRRLNLKKIKAIYTDAAHMCAGSIEPGEDEVAGPETDRPDFSAEEGEVAMRSESANGDGEDGNGPPHCYVVNGVIICV